MFVRVEITAPGQAAQIRQLDGPTIALGRDPSSHLVFDSTLYSAVSWQHARIELSPGGASITDLGSSNGTYVNGVQVIGTKLIQKGDVVGLGQTGPKLRMVEIAGADRPPAPPRTVAEKMLPHGMLTPPVSNAPLNVSSDSLRPATRRRRLPLGAIAIGLVAIGAVATAGYIVLTNQMKSDDKKSAPIEVVKGPDPSTDPKPVVPPPDPEPPAVVPKIEPKIQPKDDSKKALTPGKESPPDPEPPVPKPLIVDPMPGPSTGAEIYRRTLQSTGWVTAQRSPLLTATGTGSLVDQENRLFLTAYHVVEGVREAKIFFPKFDDEKRPISDRGHYLRNETPVLGEVILADAKRDLAVLRLQSIPEGVVELPLAPKGIEVAHRVFTVGNPGVSSALWVYTEGTVRQVVFKKFRMDNRQDVEAWMVEAQFPINQGDSGGPVLNDRNQLVGVNCSLNAKAQLMSNCVDLREIRIVLDRARRDPMPPPRVAPENRLE